MEPSPTRDAKPLRVVTVINDTGTGSGAAHSALELSEVLHARGHRIDLVYQTDGDLLDRWRVIASTITQLPEMRARRRRPLATVRSAWRAVRAVRRARADAVLLQSWHQVTLFAPVRRLFPRSTQLVLVLRSGGAHSAARFHATLRRLDGMIATCDTTRDEWHRAVGGDPDRIVTVLNGVDRRRLPQVPDSERRALRVELVGDANVPLIVYAGRLSPWKGLRELAEAFGRLRATGAVELLVVGGSAGSAAELAEAHAVVDALERSGARLTGVRVDAPALMAVADVVVLPSYGESLPRVVMEALTMGVPTVATAVGGTPELLTGPLARFLVPPRDPVALERALADALANPPSSSELQAAAARLDVGRTASDMEAVLRMWAGGEASDS